MTFYSLNKFDPTACCIILVCDWIEKKKLLQCYSIYIKKPMKKLLSKTLLKKISRLSLGLKMEKKAEKETKLTEIEILHIVKNSLPASTLLKYSWPPKYYIRKYENILP